MTSILLIDDHEIIRLGIKRLLEHLFAGTTIHEAHDEASATAKLRSLNFDLILMDIQVPNSDMFELMTQITLNYPSTKVLVFSMSAEHMYAKRFLQAGAKGFLSKNSSTEEIGKAVLMVLNNRTYISKALSETLVHDSFSNTTSNPFQRLSAREFEIAGLFLAGHTVSYISKKTNLHSSTVGTHKKRLFSKLGVRNVLELKELATIHELTIP